eukprot:3720378-Alexandrium_andersonii.AAC.1
MSASLVGSEMCIRDSPKVGEVYDFVYMRGSRSGRRRKILVLESWPVSYTHLTLPTICSGVDL